MIEAVVKVGGSLGRGESLEPLCERLAVLARSHRFLIVPGGGAFADVVRECYARGGLGESAAHWMAVLAMDQYGYLLADRIPGGGVARSLGRARTLAMAGRVPVLLPCDLLRRADPLPHSWTVTADSIAAWVAGRVGAATLVLLKDSRGMAGAPLRGEPHTRITLQQLAGWKGVDPHLSTLLRTGQLDLWVVNGEQPERLGELLTTGRTPGVHLPQCGPSAGAPPPGPPAHADDRPDTPQCAHR